MKSAFEWAMGYWRQALVALLLLTAFVSLVRMPQLASMCAGIALFLMGMLQLDQSIKALSGGLLERGLQASTRSPLRSLLFGALSTALIQSSTLVTLISMSFVGAGLITLSAAIVVLFGANLGTTSGAWLMATLGLRVDMAVLSMPFLVTGFALSRVKWRQWQAIGGLLLGIALIFLGIHYLKLGFDGLDDAWQLQDWYRAGFLGILIFVGLGTLLTVIMQSSHASLLITLAAMSSGQIPYEAGLALAIGANVGTTLTAILGALSSNAMGKRFALAHVFFNVVTALVALLLILPLMQLVEWIAYLLRWDENEFLLRLALFHTLFNCLGILIFFPLVKPLANWLQRLWLQPVQAVESAAELVPAKAEFLISSALQTADTALQAVEQQYQALLHQSLAVIADGLHLTLDDSLQPEVLRLWLAQNWQQQSNMDQLYRQRIKPIQAQMIDFIWQATDLANEQQDKRLRILLAASRTLVESVKHAKHLQKNMVHAQQQDNPALKELYLGLRLMLNEVCWRLQRLQDQPDSISELIQFIDQHYQHQAKELWQSWQHALRQRLLDGHSGSSWLNDLNYSHDLLYSLQESLLYYAGTSLVAQPAPLVQLE